MIVLNILGYFGRNKQNSYAALTTTQVSSVVADLIAHLDQCSC